MYRRYYHVTLERCVSGIIDYGLDPGLSRGKIPAVWLADSKRLHWALAHVAVKHNVLIADLWVATVHVDPRDLQRFRWPGIYLCKHVIPIHEIYQASTILDRGPIRLVGERK